MKYSYFIAIVVFGFFGFGCATLPYMNLRHPIYLVTDQSFWSDCPDDPDDPDDHEVCRTFRVKQVKAGVDQWFNYFDKANRPTAVIVFSKEKLPSNRINTAIYLKIEAGFCGNGASACYASGASSSSFSSPEIVFEASSRITSNRMAHEFGHALGRDDNDVPEGKGSVMSYKIPTSVLLMDIEMMCNLHRECRMVKSKPRLNQ